MFGGKAGVLRSHGAGIRASRPTWLTPAQPTSTQGQGQVAVPSWLKPCGVREQLVPNS